MSVVLETQADRAAERMTVDRITGEDLMVPFGRFSRCDYLRVIDGRAVRLEEIKSRKESLPIMRSSYPEGIVLKERKAEELSTLQDLLSVTAGVWFAFRSGRGALCWVPVSRLSGLTPVSPKRRRNYRDLECDTEPVLYVPWDMLTVAFGPLPLDE